MPPQEETVSEEPQDEACTVSTAAPQRRGDAEKCPVCGSRVDSEAYYCPTCQSFYCFHCRARLLPSDTQLQCVNQCCEYYGKLVCGVCDAAAEKEEPPAVYSEPEDGYWPAWLVLILVTAPMIWYFQSLCDGCRLRGGRICWWRILASVVGSQHIRTRKGN